MIAATLLLSRAESSLAGALIAIMIVQLASMLLGRGDERRGARISGLGVARGPYLAKPITAIDSSGGAVDSKAVDRLGPISFGVASMQGWRSHMEDAHTLCAPTSGPLCAHALVGVFDGHGGDFAAQFASSQLVPVLIETKEWRRYRTLRMRAARCRRAARRTAIAHSGGRAHEGHDDDDDYEEEEAEDADVPSRSAAGSSVEREAAVKAGRWQTAAAAAAAASSAAASEAATEAEDAAANALGIALQHAFIDLDERLRAACHDRGSDRMRCRRLADPHRRGQRRRFALCVLARTAPDVPRARQTARRLLRWRARMPPPARDRLRSRSRETTSQPTPTSMRASLRQAVALCLAVSTAC